LTDQDIGRPLRDLDTPTLVADLDIMERNIERLVGVIVRDAGVQWRPHTKAMKSPAIARKLLAAGASGITCAKLGEAEVMAAAGIDDILIANQIVGPTKIARLVALRQTADVMVAVDAVANIEMLGAAASAAGVEVRVVVEVDVGMGRAGVPPGAAPVDLARVIDDTSGVLFAGLFTWESHALGVTDPDEKRRTVQEALARVESTADQCRDAGIPVGIVSCGGTGTYVYSAHCPGVTEIQAGGGVWGDLVYGERLGVDHEYALTVLSTVTSRPTPTRIICDAGRKTMSMDAAVPRPRGIEGVADVRLSAEHGIVTLDDPSDTPRVGDTFEFVVGYSDTTVCLHDAIVAVRNGVVETVWDLPGRGKLQ
jgi:D-serine deaminase-like pyridoxal phosphate-dependent protein